MSEFNDPKMAINKVYTKTGDSGKTSLVGGQRVAKNNIRIETYGTVDELNAHLGSAIESARLDLPEGDDKAWFLATLVRVQHELFNLGAILATLPQDVHPKQPRILEGDILQLEADIDRTNDSLPMLRSFVLPGGCRTNTDLHVCRTVCRRAERIMTTLCVEEAVDTASLKYVNRLSDAFFVWSRWVMVLRGTEEVLWQPNLAASAGKE